MCNRRTYIKSNVISKNNKFDNIISENFNETNSMSKIKQNNDIIKKKSSEKRTSRHKYTISELDLINNSKKLEDINKNYEKKDVNNAFTIELKPLRSHLSELNNENRKKKQLLKSHSINLHGLTKRVSSSMQMLKDIIFEPKENVFESLSKTIPTQNILFNIKPTYYEIFFDIWIEKGVQIFFQIKKDCKWGVEEKGLIDYLGYENEKKHKFNFCCLLMRVGNEKKYNLVMNNSPYYSKFSGPLFLKMNISKKDIEQNNYHLIGELSCEVYNARKFSRFQIFKKLNFNCYDDCNYYNVLNILNTFRIHPHNFINLFFATQKLLNFNEKSVKSNLIKSENLKKLCDIEIDKNDSDIENENENYLIEEIEKIKGEKIIDPQNWIIKKFILFSDNDEPINIIKNLIKANKYSFIFQPNLKYIGISIKEKYTNNTNYIKCCFIASNLFI